jgi:anti-anti-sigma factor
MTDLAPSTLALPERLDTATAPRVRAAIAHCLADAAVHDVLIDGGRVQTVDDVGLGALLAADHAVRAQGGRLRLRSASPVLVERLRETRLAAHFGLADE